MGGDHIREFEKRGLRVLHKLTLDFHPVELYDLVESVLFIDEGDLPTVLEV